MKNNLKTISTRMDNESLEYINKLTKTFNLHRSTALRLIFKKGLEIDKQERALELLKKWCVKRRGSRTNMLGDVFIDPITDRKIIDNKEKHTYNLTVEDHHSLICSGITAFQCDGDEDCVMLLLDCLINFSRHYLTEKRG